MPSRALVVKTVLCNTNNRPSNRPRWAAGTGSTPPATVVGQPSHGHGSIRVRLASVLSASAASSSILRRYDSTPMDHDNVLASLLSANSQWAEAVKKTDPDFFKRSAEGQHPKILWLGCSDSRVPESVVTASPPGYIFVHRNIANQLHPHDESALAVMTYSIGHIKSIEHIIVVGHTHCGGAETALALVTEKPPPAVEPVIQTWLTPLVELAKRLVNGPHHPDILLKLVEDSVGVQVNNVAHSEPVRKAWAEGRKNLWVHGLVYHVETGELRNLNITRGPPS